MSLAATKLFISEAHQASHKSDGMLSLRGKDFGRVWLQGVVVRGDEEGQGLFCLDDGTGVVMVALEALVKSCADQTLLTLQTGQYVMVIGTLEGPPVGVRNSIYVPSRRRVIAHQVIDLSLESQRESLWIMEVIHSWSREMKKNSKSTSTSCASQAARGSSTAAARRAGAAAGNTTATCGRFSPE